MLKPRFFRLFGREKPVRKVFSIDFLLIVEGWFSPIDFWRKGGKSFHQSSGTKNKLKFCIDFHLKKST
ncbi:hypothetical protein CsatB_006437 [Cannabis sativa]